MAEKDIIEKTLESYNDVFADIVNVLLFDGKQVVNENDLEAESEQSMYKVDGQIHNQERDVAKYWKNGTIRISLFGFENQTKVDSDMPLRILSYDGSIYRNQLNDKKSKKHYPVVTIVLYFGDEDWNKSLHLKDCLEIPEGLENFVNDYKINLFQITKLTQEQVNLFKSDFKSIADYFVNKDNENYKGSTDIIKHTTEFFELMKILSNDNRFIENYNERIKIENGGVSMCKVIDRAEARGKEIGKEIGKETVVISMLEDNTPIQQIIKWTGVSEERIKELKETLKAKV